MLSRASLMVRRIGVRHVSGSEALAVGGNFGTMVGCVFAIAGGFYALDTKIETKTNHLETKLDTLAQAVNNVNVSVARIEEHMRRN